MAFNPKVLNPTPDPFFVRELKKLDPDLRVTWAYERYLKSCWAIERKTPAERYFTMYESILSSDENRFIERPIFDTAQPVYNSDGDKVGYKQVGTQKYDLAPEYEWLMFSEALDQRALTRLRQEYAWNRQPYSRQRFEKEQEEEAKQKAFDKKLDDAALEGFDEAMSELRKKVVFGYGETRKE